VEVWWAENKGFDGLQEQTEELDLEDGSEEEGGVMLPADDAGSEADGTEDDQQPAKDLSTAGTSWHDIHLRHSLTQIYRD
jgi:hypothetical protein